MSELLYYLTPRPADVPIRTKGNELWRSEERFLLKGVSYLPRNPGARSFGNEPLIDPLTDDRLPELEKDIALIHELGLNSIFVYRLDHTQSHTAALKLLENAGIYVLVRIFEVVEAPKVVLARPANERETIDPDFDTTSRYCLESVKKALTLVHELAEHPNILGFAICGSCLTRNGASKIAEVLRAAVRDTKAFLSARGGRQVPVGVSVHDRVTLRIPSLQYFSAGAVEERVDFFANESWSWAGPSSFQISGWKNMVENFERTSPVPMFLSAYGTAIGKPRVWDEVLCLYSPYMMGTFSGGFVYTLLESGNGFGLVKIADDGKRVREDDFRALKKRMREVNVRLLEEVASGQVRD